MSKTEKLAQIEVQVYSTGKKYFSKQCRLNRQIPAVIYGPEMSENIHVVVDYVAFEKIFPSVQRNIPLELLLEKKKIQVLIKEYQIHPVSREFIHIDFYCIAPGRPYSTMIPIDYQGTPIGVKEGGSLFAYIKTLSIRGTVESIPKSLCVNISDLQRKRNITVRNIEVPKHCQILTNKGSVLAEVK